MKPENHLSRLSLTYRSGSLISTEPIFTIFALASYFRGLLEWGDSLNRSNQYQTYAALLKMHDHR